MEYSEFIMDFEVYVSNTLKGLTQEKVAHPTQVLANIISRTYGHEVPLSKLIALIETSPLSIYKIQDGKKTLKRTNPLLKEKIE